MMGRSLRGHVGRPSSSPRRLTSSAAAIMSAAEALSAIGVSCRDGQTRERLQINVAYVRHGRICKEDGASSSSPVAISAPSCWSPPRAPRWSRCTVRPGHSFGNHRTGATRTDQPMPGQHLSVAQHPDPAGVPSDRHGQRWQGASVPSNRPRARLGDVLQGSQLRCEPGESPPERPLEGRRADGGPRRRLTPRRPRALPGRCSQP